MKYLNHYECLKENEAIKSNLIKGNNNDERPFVSVIIPTYNRPCELEAAINSALNQKGFKDYEVIVIDNEPTRKNNTECLIEKYVESHFFYYKNESNLGMIGNWNRGIELAKGEWIVILHDDDLLHPLFLSTMTAHIIDDMEMLICSVCPGREADIQRFLKKENQTELFSIKRLNGEQFLIRNQVNFPGILIKREVILALGGFNQELNPIPDYSFWVRVVLRGKSYAIKAALAFYRLSDIQYTAGLKKGFFGYDTMLRAELYQQLKKKKLRARVFYELGFIKEAYKAKHEFRLNSLSEFEPFFEIKLPMISLMGKICINSTIVNKLLFLLMNFKRLIFKIKTYR